MSRIAPRIVARKSFRGTTVEQLRKEMTDAFSDIQDQLNAQGRILPHSDGTNRPRGLREHDRLMGRGQRGNITVIPDGKGGAASQEVPDSVTQYQDPQTGSGAPVVANFPVIGDFGWYYDTVATKAYFAYNHNGAVTFPDVSTFSGTITDAQHGARSGGTLHAAATDSVAGFLSAVDKTFLDGATSANTASALCQRDANGDLFVRRIQCSHVYIGGVQILSAQPSGWSVTGIFTPRTNLNANTSLPLSNTVLGDVIYTIVSALITHGILGP